MTVSIVMPVYNVQLYIKETLDSFIQQTLEDFEIICVDDGSTDATPQIVEEYMAKDSRIKLVHQKNAGAGAARNTGIKYATGKYLYFFDGDDWCLPDLLEKLVVKANRTGADIVVLDYYRIDDQTKKEQLYHGLDTKSIPMDQETFCWKDVPEKILSVVNPTPWNKLYNREFVLSTGLSFMELSTTNDITFCALSVAMAEKIAYVGQPLMYYRMNRADSVTSKKTKNLLNVLLAVQAVTERASMLPYAQQIEASIKKFTVDNLIFALENYAGDFRSKTYKSYYQELHKIFNGDFLRDTNFEAIKNQKRFDTFQDIQNKTYWKKFIEKVQLKICNVIKGIRYPSLSYFDNRTDQLLRRNSSETKNIQDQLNTLKKSEELLVRRTRAMQREIDVMKNRLYTIETLLSVKSHGLNQLQRETRIIISMTSFPGRIQFVPLTLERLMNQTIKPDKIVLWLAKEQFPNQELDLPYRLLEMKQRGLDINWCEDLKAYKKLLPSLKEYPNDIIITVDDDLLFDIDMVENLYETHRIHPKAIIASRVHKIVCNADGTVAPYSEWEKEIDYDTYEPRHDLFVTGGAGTLFPPNLFDNEIFNTDIIKSLCPWADDIWINVMAAIRKIPIVYTGKSRHLKYIEGTQQERLYNVNIRENDIQLHNLLEHYGNVFQL